MAKQIVVYGLLFVTQSIESVNSKVKSRQQGVREYLLNALLLSKSLSSFGQRFVLLTNERNYLTNLLFELGRNDDLEINEIEFKITPPEGIRFGAAHRKIDVFNYIATSGVDFGVLIDLDVVCIKDPSHFFLSLATQGAAGYYNITSQVVPAYGSDVISADKSMLAGRAMDEAWAGGEFLAGAPSFFAEIYRKSLLLWPRYLNLASKLHHQGDEMIVSVALDDMRREGNDIRDCGDQGITRIWSGNVKHSQTRVLQLVKLVHFLHLPQDKRFLAKYYARRRSSLFSGSKLVNSYLLHFYVRRIGCMLKAALTRLTQKQR
jgi:hypothetical protein